MLTAGWYAVAVLWLAYICSFVDRQVLALLVDPIRASLSIGDTQFSLLQGLAFGLFYALMGLPCGALVDRFDRRRVIAGGIALWSVATVSCGFAGGFWSLFAARMLVGIGEATLSPGALSLLSDAFVPEKRVLPMSIYVSAGSFGGGLAMVAGGAAMTYVANHPIALPGGMNLDGWRAAFVLVGLPGLAIAALMLTIREPARARMAVVAAAKPGWQTAWVFMRARRGFFLRHFGGFVLFSWLAYSILSWAPAFFIRVHGWTLAETGLRVGLAFLILGPLGAVSGGVFATRVRKSRTDGNLWSAAVGVAAIVVPSVAAPLAGNPYLSLALFGLALFFSAFPSGASATAISELTPGHLRGTVAAVYYLLMTVVGLTLGPLSVAALTDYFFVDPKRVGDSMALVAAVISPLAALLVASGLPAFRMGYAANDPWAPGAAPSVATMP